MVKVNKKLDKGPNRHIVSNIINSSKSCYSFSYLIIFDIYTFISQIEATLMPDDYRHKKVLSHPLWLCTTFVTTNEPTF